jgi:hypothetical protein
MYALLLYGLMLNPVGVYYLFMIRGVLMGGLLGVVNFP